MKVASAILLISLIGCAYSSSKKSNKVKDEIYFKIDGEYRSKIGIPQ